MNNNSPNRMIFIEQKVNNANQVIMRKFLEPEILITQKIFDVPQLIVMPKKARLCPLQKHYYHPYLDSKIRIEILNNPHKNLKLSIIHKNPPKLPPLLFSQRRSKYAQQLSNLTNTQKIYHGYTKQVNKNANATRTFNMANSDRKNRETNYVSAKQRYPKVVGNLFGNQALNIFTQESIDNSSIIFSQTELETRYNKHKRSQSTISHTEKFNIPIHTKMSFSQNSINTSRMKNETKKNKNQTESAILKNSDNKEQQQYQFVFKKEKKPNQTINNYHSSQSYISDNKSDNSLSKSKSFLEFLGPWEKNNDQFANGEIFYQEITFSQ